MTHKQLKKFLERMGLNQCAAARALKVDERTMRRWVAGDRPVPYTAELALRYLQIHPEMAGGSQEDGQ